MQVLEIANSPLKNINPNNYTISIRPRPGGYCFVLYDRVEHRFPVLYDATANSTDALLALWEKMGIEPQRFYSTYVLCDCPQWTLLPLDMKEADPTTAWKLNFGTEPSTPIQETAVQSVGAKIIFTPDDRSRILASKLPNATLVPIAAADIMHTAHASQATQGHYIGLNIREKQLNLYVADKGRLLLANTYSTDTTSDVLYFAMNAVRIFQLNQEDTALEAWGKEPNEAVGLLKNYLKNASVAELNNRFAYDNGIKKLTNKHEYYDLFNIELCAL